MPKAGKTKVAAKSVKLIHPQSRKANKVGAREIHKERVRKVHQETSFKNSVLIEKLKWFQDALDPDKTNYSRADAEEIVERYLERFEEELEQISIVNSIKSRSGRQHATREDVIKQTMNREEEQFNTCGFEIPDICDGKNLKLFRLWDGSPKFLGNIKMRRIVRTIPDLSDFGSQSTNSHGLVERGQELDNERVDEQGGDHQGQGDDDGDDDEGVEDDLLDSNEEEMEDERNDSKEDEGVESL
ncbi:translation machinery-associated protein 16-like [Lytechinus pictus]|uniref:translation machinery-associated protein 16-like n=1 Tax=Lytechinus pictus TaxID=7653 RepID=UPI0030B9B23A